MAWSFNKFALIASFLQLGSVVSGAATWPSSYDELEDIMSMTVNHSPIDLD